MISLETHSIAPSIGHTKPLTTPSSIPPKRLWIYAICTYAAEGAVNIKIGVTAKATHQDALAYALHDTIQKLRGSFTPKDVLGIWDMTSHAIKLDPRYDPTLPKPRNGYDNAIRKSFSSFLPRKLMINQLGQRSLEVHPVPAKMLENVNWREDLVYLLNDTMEKLLDPMYAPPKKVYTGRKYLEDSFNKVQHNTKHLLAAATGAGKETSTLALISHIHAIKKFDYSTVNVAVATIPGTISELLHELATVDGIHVESHGYVDFTKIKAYVSEQWFNNHGNNCDVDTRMFIQSSATIVSKFSDIPPFHGEGVIPIFFGSYHDVAQKAEDLSNPRYAGIDKRIGTLSIGEAHQMLSNGNNKMWKNINEAYGNKCFKLFITGTPYDFIYGNVAAEHFSASHRSVFTRNDVYSDKRLNPSSNFIDYPDFNFYALENKDMISILKNDPRWKDDKDGFTWKKLFEFDVDTKTFKYEISILGLFTRLFGSNAFDESGDPLSVYNAPNLCKQAKQHIMVALPPGKKGASADVYIGELKNLLIKHNIFQGTIYDAYDDDLGDRKVFIANDPGRTITLTCVKDCTGANIPELGSFVFLRNIGDSVKFFEQATGRVGRVSDGKTNCGIFLGDLEATINIMLVVEEKLAIERGEAKGTGVLLSELIANYNFFTSLNGKWGALDVIDLAKSVEELNANGNYGINQCINPSSAPLDFDLSFNNTVATELSALVLNENGNEGAKDSAISGKAAAGAILDIDQARSINWHNMKLNFVANLRYLAYVYNTNTVQECVELVEDAILNNKKKVLKIVGSGVQYFPIIMNNPLEIDIAYTNRWIHKFNNVKHDVDQVLSMFADPMHRTDTSFVAEPKELTREMVLSVVNRFISEGKDFSKLTFIDPCAGRGGFLLALIEIAKELNLNLNPVNLFYNDIDSSLHELFKAINLHQGLNIPDENITNMDFLNQWPTDQTFDAILGNAPVNHPSNSKGNKPWPIIVKNSTQILKDNGYIAMIIPVSWVSGGNNTTSKFGVYKDVFIKNNLISSKVINMDSHFTDIGVHLSWFLMQKNDKYTHTSFTSECGEFDVDITSLEFLPNDIHTTTLSLYKKLFVGTKKFKIQSFDRSKCIPKTDRHIVPSDENNIKHWVKWNGDDEVFYYWKEDVSKDFSGIRKVIFPINRVAKMMYYDDVGIAVAQQGFCLDIGTLDMENVKSVWNSRLFTFLTYSIHASHLKSNIIHNLPFVDMTRKWDNISLYDHFGLTADEIAYIESV